MMLEVCAVECRPGAHVWMVVPPVGTKGEAADDREQFSNIARGFGLRPINEFTDALYRTPLFELAALERQGIARLAAWRRGDVLAFIVDDAPMVATIPPIRTACELTFAGVRLRLLASPAVGPRYLTPIVEGEVFPSVSSRAPGRGRANLWTSGNRAFCVDPDAARTAMEEIARRGALVLHMRLTPDRNDLDRLADVAPSDELIHQLIGLLGRELDDARRLVGDGAWLGTANSWRF